MKGEQLFTFQRKYGSTRVAETVVGGELFSVKDFGYEERGLWIVEFACLDRDAEGSREGGKGTEKEERWVVKSSEDGRGIEVEVEGREVGRVQVVGGRVKGHDVSFFFSFCV